jgi:hypothetical protein
MNAPAVLSSSDLARYREIQAEWRALLERGVAPDAPELQALWHENEKIKNRHEGMPPTE